MNKKQADRVVGVYEHPDRDLPWEMRYVAGGKSRSRWFKTETNAEKAAAKKHLALQGPAQLPGAVSVDSQSGDSRRDWTAALELYRDRLVANPADHEAQDALRYLAQGANAAAKLIDAESRRRRLERLERQVKQEREERASGVVHAKRSKRGDKAGAT